MPASTPEERALVARIASAERWAKEPDRAAATEPARKGLRAAFERRVDPDGVLDPVERSYRADKLMDAHMLRMSLAAKQARRRAKELIEVAEAAEGEWLASGGAA